MNCNCEPKKYSIGMGCCVPVLAPIENYYTKHQIDEMLEEIESGETSGCCITPEEVDEKIDAATSGIDQNIDAISGDVITISGDLQAVSAEVESISGLTSGDVQTMIDESVSGKADYSDFSAHTANTDIHVTAEEKAYWNSKADIKDLIDAIDRINEEIEEIWAAISGTPTPPTPPTPTGYSQQYLTFEVLEVPEDGFISFSNWSGCTSEVSYSLDSGATWTPYTTSLRSLSVGDKIMWKGHVISQTDHNSHYGRFGSFYSICKINVEGNIMSLLYDDFFADKTDLMYPYIFCQLFYLNEYIVSAENLVLPATVLTPYCYQGMFGQCYLLTKAPQLIALNLSEGCYGGMFGGCRALTSVPQLPATALTVGCYDFMFQDCTGLTTIPSGLLPATTLAENCYEYMFWNCTSLQNAPTLPATTLVKECYASMFWGCTSLTTVPSLPATTLAKRCYSGMFYGCSNLNEITCLATDISATFCTTNWVNGVAANGTFKTPSSTNWESGVHGIPSGWTRVDI